MSKSDRLLYGVGTHRPPSFRRLPDCLRLLPLHVGHLVAAEVHITVERVIKLKLGLERDECELMENVVLPSAKACGRRRRWGVEMASLSTMVTCERR